LINEEVFAAGIGDEHRVGVVALRQTQRKPPAE